MSIEGVEEANELFMQTLEEVRVSGNSNRRDFIEVTRQNLGDDAADRYAKWAESN